MFKKIKDTIHATIMCIKYPFLYPRNVFTDRHYNNWKLIEYIRDNNQKACKFISILCENVENPLDEGRNVFSIFNGEDGISLHLWPYDSLNIVEVYNGTNLVYDFKITDFADIKTSDDYSICFSESGWIKIKVKNGIKIKKAFDNFVVIKNYFLYFKIKFAEFLNDKLLQLFHCIPTWSYEDFLSTYEGWYKAFGEDLLDELKTQLKKDHYLYKFRIHDIKEKYGSLRIYVNAASREVYNILDKYEDLSYHTCIKCGKPSKYLTGGYILPYCEDCFDKDRIPYATIGEDGSYVYDDRY